MATLRQTLANRLNALKSTGPRSAEGKLKSSLNAMKHGLSRLGAMPPAHLADAIADRKEQWSGDYRPKGPSQSWHFERLCAESVRLDACERRLLAARAEHAKRAAESWDDDRAAEIAALASRLATRPDQIQPTLLQSRHGVLWMLERWQELAEGVQRHQGWTSTHWQRALDLLGLSSMAREGMSPSELNTEQDGPEPALELIQQSMTALRERLETILEPRDARARADAEAGLSADDPPEVRRLERYAADARRRVTAHLNELRRLQGLESGPKAAQPRPFRQGPPGPWPNRPPRSNPASSPPPPATPKQSRSDRESPIRPGLATMMRDQLRQSKLNRHQRRALASASRRS